MHVFPNLIHSLYLFSEERRSAANDHNLAELEGIYGAEFDPT
jgi:hypothetical protein